MNRVCLDTSAYSHFMRGHPPVVEILRGTTRVGVPVVVFGELRTGFRDGSQTAKSEAGLKVFLAQPVVSVFDVDEEAASIYADLVVELRRTGTPLPSNDVWIAAVAVRKGATVITYDSHFEGIRRVGVRLLNA